MKKKLVSLSQNHLLLSAFYKCLSGLTLFISISILIKYLGETNYGVWILVFTLFQWILMMDFGISSVLKTKIPELLLNNQKKLLNSYIKSTYKIIGWVSLVIFIFLSLLVCFLDLKSIFLIPLETSFIQKIFILNIFFFCINFILNTNKALYISFLKGKFSEQSIGLNQIVFLIALLIINYFGKEQTSETKLVLITLANGLIMMMINIFYTIYLFKIETIKFNSHEILPTKIKNEIYSLGGKYMFLQIGSLFLFSSDTYILSYFFGPKEIVPYEVVSKYFQFSFLIVMAGISPLWSMFSKYYHEKNYIWLKKSMNKFYTLFIGIIVFLIFQVLFSKFIFKIWIADTFEVSFLLVILMAVMIGMRIFSMYFSYFLNGIGNLKSYIVLLSISLVIKIPLSYLFITLNYGISSVVFSSIFCLILWCIYFPYQTNAIINKIKN